MVYVFLADGFEEVEAITPIDYLRRAGLQLRTVGVTGKTVTGAHGIEIATDIKAKNIVLDDELQMIVLPGGMPGTINLMNNKFVNKAIDYCASNDIPIAAICAAPSILGDKRLLEGKIATCYAGFEKKLIGATLGETPVCKDGNYITAKSAAYAQDFAFTLVETLCGEEALSDLKSALLIEK